MAQETIEQVNDNDAVDLTEEDAADVADDGDEGTEEEADDSSAEEVEETEESQEEPPEKSDDEGDEYVDEETYFASIEGLPENIKSLDELVKAYQATLPEMKRGQTAAQRLEQVDTLLKAQGYEGGINSILTGAKPTPKAQQQQTDEQGKNVFFGSNPFSAVLKDWEGQGRFGDDQDSRRSYQSLAKFADEALKPVIERAEYMAGFVNNLAGQLLDVRWQTWNHPKKGEVNKDDLFRVMSQYPTVGGLDEAFNLLAIANPNLLTQITKKAEEAGRKEGQKKLKRFKGLRRDKPGSGGGKKYDYNKYLNSDGTWNDDKLNQLPDFGVAMLDAYEKEYRRSKNRR